MRHAGRIGAIAAVAVVAIALLGRHEAATASKSQVKGMAHLLLIAGPDWPSTPSAYRLTPTYDCLFYRAGGNPFAIELCFDADGRVVQAVDRRGSSPVFWNLSFDPEESTLRVDPSRLAAAFVALGAAPRGTRTIPLGHFDHGPILIKHGH